MESDGRRRLRTLHCMKCGAPLTLRTASIQTQHDPHSPPNALTRQVCSKEGCDWVFYQNPVPVVAAIVEHDDGLGRANSRGIVLVRGRGWPASWFGVVSGFLETREDPALGVLREVKEELGLDASIVSFLGVYPFERANQLILAYHVRATTPGQPVLLQEEELEAWKKVDIAQLRPWSQGTGPAVRDFLIQQTGSSPPALDLDAPQRRTNDAKTSSSSSSPRAAALPSKL